jgi:uncharacterized protein (DUF2336 family)
MASTSNLQARESLLSELEDAVRSGSRDKHVDTLRRITDLFLSGADRFKDEQIALFDDVLERLLDRIEIKTLHELSKRLAPIASAPPETVRRLAYHDDSSVAAPILANSSRLITGDLVEIAKTKSQEHLLAISGRQRLGEAVTDALTDRGNDAVMHKLAGNVGARFSEGGLSRLTARAESDEGLAELLGRRIDVPIESLRKLLDGATEAVRARLFSALKPEQDVEIGRAVVKISRDMVTDIDRDFSEARRTIGSMQQAGKLNESAVLTFAISNRFEHVIAALAALSSAPFELVEQSMRTYMADAILVLCKAVGFEWATVRTIVKMKSVNIQAAGEALEYLKEEYAKLSMATARRLLRFWQVREKTRNIEES